MSVHSKMTALADDIRELSGTTEAMGLDAMAENVSEANDEITTQTELLAQAVAALEGKAGGSGGSGGVETCTVTIVNELLYEVFPGWVEGENLFVCIDTYDGNKKGEILDLSGFAGEEEGTRTVRDSVVRDSLMYAISPPIYEFSSSFSNLGVKIDGNAEKVDYWDTGMQIIRILGDCTITFVDEEP